MWRWLTALVVLAMAGSAPALAQMGGGVSPPPAPDPAETGGAAVPPAAAEPEAAPTGGVVVGGGGSAPPPADAPTPAPLSAPPPAGPPPAAHEPEPLREPEEPAFPPLTRISDLDARPPPAAVIAVRAQQEDPLKDLPQLAPPARDEPSPPAEPPAAEPQAEQARPRLAHTGLETLVLAYVGFVLFAIGLATFAVLRKARRCSTGAAGRASASATGPGISSSAGGTWRPSTPMRRLSVR